MLAWPGWQVTLGDGGLGTGGRAAEGLALARWLPTPHPRPSARGPYLVELKTEGVTWEAWLCTQLERGFLVLFEIKL